MNSSEIGIGRKERAWWQKFSMYLFQVWRTKKTIVEDFALLFFICDYFRTHCVVVRLGYPGCVASCDCVCFDILNICEHFLATAGEIENFSGLKAC
jgi:hypothetical protein